MSEIRDTEVDFQSLPQGQEGDEKIMSVLSLLALNQQRQVRSWVDTELLVSVNIKVHIRYVQYTRSVLVHLCIMNLHCSCSTVRMERLILLLWFGIENEKLLISPSLYKY